MGSGENLLAEGSTVMRVLGRVRAHICTVEGRVRGGTHISTESRVTGAAGLFSL